MIENTPWIWEQESEFRTRLADIRAQHGSMRFEVLADRHLEAAAGPTMISRGYVKIVRAAAWSADGARRSEFRQLALAVIDGEVCRRLIFPFAPVRKWFPLVIDFVVLNWVLRDGDEEQIPTIIASDEHGIVVATARELPLPVDFWVERQLAITEREFRSRV